MKYILLACLFATGIALASGPLPPAPRKKGIGLAESSGMGLREFNALNVDWYYNWGARSDLPIASKFVPMAFSPQRVADLPAYSRYVLGFNEPDNDKQAHVKPEVAFQAWPALMRKADVIGSPALAKNPLSAGNWLASFLGLGPRVDFLAVHWYKGIEARKLIADVQAICTAYGKPVWLTEFAPQTAAQARTEPQKYSQAQVDQFIQESTAWMATSDCVQRYAWHDAKTGTSALFENGRLTATGQTYAAVTP
jgi:hypothetical protein